MNLMEAVDKNVPLPVRDIDKAFAMPIETFSRFRTRHGGYGPHRARQGEGGEEVEIWASARRRKKVVDGRENVKKLLDEGLAGDNVGLLLRGTEKRRRGARAGGVQARVDHATHEIQGRKRTC